MISQILSILIDLPRTVQSRVPFFQSFFNSLDLNYSETSRDIKKR